MISPMRRLHERSHASRGIVVDGDGAMLGPDYVLRFVETTWGSPTICPGFSLILPSQRR
jgi:hypothetical protein